jgi:hypothetical protein
MYIERIAPAARDLRVVGMALLRTEASVGAHSEAQKGEDWIELCNAAADISS